MEDFYKTAFPAGGTEGLLAPGPEEGDEDWQ